MFSQGGRGDFGQKGASGPKGVKGEFVSSQPKKKTPSLLYPVR